MGSTNGNSSRSLSSLTDLTSSMRALISSSSQMSMAPKYLETHEGYFISLLMLTFIVCSLCVTENMFNGIYSRNGDRNILESF